MEWMQLQPESIRALALTLLTLAITLYLIRLDDKALTTRLLTLYMGVSTLGFLAWFFEDAVTDPQLVPYMYDVTSICGFVSTAIHLHFAYRFLDDPYPREARVVLTITYTAGFLVMGIPLAILALGLGTPPDLFLFVVAPIFLVALFFTPLWIGVVYLRKAVHCSRAEALAQEADVAVMMAEAEPDADPVPRRKATFWHHLLHPQGEQARTLRAFSVMGLLEVLFILVNILPLSAEQTGEVGEGVVRLLLISAFIVLYLNHSKQPTTFQVKLVGLSLVVTLVILVVVGLVFLNPDTLTREADLPVLNQQTLRFSHDGEGGYHIAAEPLTFDPDLGDALRFDQADTVRFEIIGETDDSFFIEDTVSVSLLDLGFAFPFSGTRWDALRVRFDGMLYFHTDARPYPVLIPLSSGFLPTLGGQVYFRRDSSRVMVTWQDVRADTRTDPSTFQVALYADGGIAFHYVSIPPPSSVADVHRRLIGLGGGPGAESTLPLDFTADLPTSVRAEQNPVYRIERAYRQAIHSKVASLAYLMVGSALFIVLLFPLFFRASLIHPLKRLLDGVRRVDAGELETTVPIQVHDEIGTLTQSFNRMTASLQRYSREMEALVAARTAALKASLADLKTTQAQLIQAEKMASLGQLTAGIAHEIKNPLNFVNNFAEVNEELAQELHELLGDDVADGVQEVLADLKQNAGVIAQHGKRADGIVHAMMQHASGSAGQREATDINALVSEHIDLAYHGKRAQVQGLQVEIERSLGERVGQLEMVPQEIGRVLLNLLGNAFDAVQGMENPKVTVSTRQIEGQVEIRVSDNGPGIPVEIRDRIFEPFFTTKPTGTGTGLGLSLSYDIVTQGHGGTLTVESEDGEGATFLITLHSGDQSGTLIR